MALINFHNQAWRPVESYPLPSLTSNSFIKAEWQRTNAYATVRLVDVCTPYGIVRDPSWLLSTEMGAIYSQLTPSSIRQSFPQPVPQLINSPLMLSLPTYTTIDVQQPIDTSEIEENDAARYLSELQTSQDGKQRCVNCYEEDTPLWRKGPAGPKTLCNACGLAYKKALKHRIKSTPQNIRNYKVWKTGPR